MPEPLHRYRLLSKDDDELRMNEKALRLSTTLSNLIDNLDYTPERIETTDAIPVRMVSTASLKLVIEWCEHHENDGPTVAAEATDWDRAFLDMDLGELWGLMCAANYLDIHGLIEIIGKLVARMAAGKSPAELRQLFGIPTDEEDEAEEARRRQEAADGAADGAK